MTDRPFALPRISDYAALHAAERPDRIAIVFEDERVTYRDLQSRVDRLAKALLAAGIEKGDRVAMLGTPRTEFWVSFLATASIGALWVGLNPRHTRDELLYVVQDCAPRVLFSLAGFEGRSFADDLDALRAATPGLDRVVLHGGDGLALEDFRASGSTVPDERLARVRADVDRFDPTLIVYTSGTTGRPKGAVLTHWGLSFGAQIQAEHFQVSSPSLVVCFPIDHVASVADTCATTFVRGGTIVFQERFDPGAWLEAIEAERCTIWGGIPTMLQLQLAHPDLATTDLSSVELVLWGGAPMPRAGIQRLAQLSPRLMTAYGLTETSCHVTYSDADAGLDVLAETVGRPDLRCPCRIVDDRGIACGAGVPGEVQFAGDYLASGYWNRPDATRDLFTADGWLRTGDVGLWRDDGNLQLVGRMSDMFKSGGYNVYPREVEVALESLDEVAMAAVVAAPDPLYQEVGHAYVLLEPGATVTEQGLREHCRKTLANYKVPKRFFPRTDLPLLPVGKIDKAALRAQDGPAPEA